MTTLPIASLSLPTFPARPINGGRLDIARPKSGTWLYQPKFNGWRAVVHTPTGTMFNRHGMRLAIAHEFVSALAELRGCGLEWLDCEALERRHAIGRGSLAVLDWIPAEMVGKCDQTPEGYNFSGPKYSDRRAEMLKRFEILPLNARLADNSVVIPFETEDAQTLWHFCKSQNAVLGCEFYEGVVGRDVNQSYPFQLRSSDEAFTGMMKHRWKF